ncbi:polysaccharide deacetylase family protein [Nitrococcus mobilis Nb-231]|uniref:Polysaccharide deacetylase family protein n=2 Tax=Nitrococcus mobilis TaxID=35797 RepID=A4BV08_9GAMM|nr:polysaccharide deacetylase family protein [Nitrococcus mobilis Nb-231]
MAAPRSAQAKPAVSILRYHQVGYFAAPRRHRTCYCHVRRFRSQMNYLKSFDYNVISLDEAVAGLFDDRPLPPRSVVLTFDDGYEGFHEHAFPILAQHGFTATIFIVTGLVGRCAEWLSADQVKAPLMSAETLCELHRAGITFGSHSNTHPRLSGLSVSKQRDQIFRSKAVLEELLAEEVRHFCYPYGDYGRQTRELVEEADYASALTCLRGAANTAPNRFEIPRKAISFGDNLVGYFWKLHMKHQRKVQPADR